MKTTDTFTYNYVQALGGFFQADVLVAEWVEPNKACLEKWNGILSLWVFFWVRDLWFVLGLGFLLLTNNKLITKLVKPLP